MVWDEAGAYKGALVHGLRLAAQRLHMVDDGQ